MVTGVGLEPNIIALKGLCTDLYTNPPYSSLLLRPHLFLSGLSPQATYCVISQSLIVQTASVVVERVNPCIRPLALIIVSIATTSLRCLRSTADQSQGFLLHESPWRLGPQGFTSSTGWSVYNLQTRCVFGRHLDARVGFEPRLRFMRPICYHCNTSAISRAFLIDMLRSMKGNEMKVSGTKNRDRTCDRRGMIPKLYQLSYLGILGALRSAQPHIFARFLRHRWNFCSSEGR